MGGIRIKILGLVMSIILIFGGVVTVILRNVSDAALEKSVNETITSITDGIADKLEAATEADYQMIEGISYLPYLQDENASIEEKCAYLKNLTKLDPDKYDTLLYFDATGHSMLMGKITDFSTAGYVSEALKGRRGISGPNYNKDLNLILQYYAVPIFNDSHQVVGAVGLVLKGDHVNDMIKDIDIGGGYNPIVVNMVTGNIVGDTNTTSTNLQWKNVEDMGDSPLKELIRKAIAGESGAEVYQGTFTKVMMTGNYRPVGQYSPWAVVCSAPYEYYFSAIKVLDQTLNGTIVAMLVLSFVTGILLINSIMKPLNNLQKSINEIATGNADLTKRIPVKSRDEVGKVCESFNLFCQKMQDIIREIKASKDNLIVSGKELSDESHETSSALDAMIGDVRNVNGEISVQSTSVEQTVTAVNQIASNIESLEHMIENQSKGVSEASAAVEEMIGNINSVNQSVDMMASSFGSLQKEAQEGHNKQQDVNDRIREIEDQSDMLQEANAAIAAIAEQTNLLAMNAAIEAAHAGEAGKGFSVVADEIRKLSETSQGQSKTIGDQLNKIKESIGNVVGASQDSSRAFDNVNSRITDTNQIVMQIKAAMEEQTIGSRQISDSLHSMNDSTLEVKNASHEMSEGNRSIISEIQQLRDATNHMLQGLKALQEGIENISEAEKGLEKVTVNMDGSIHSIGEQIDLFKI